MGAFRFQNAHCRTSLLAVENLMHALQYSPGTVNGHHRCSRYHTPAGAGDTGEEHEGGAVGAGRLRVAASQARQMRAAILQAGIPCALLQHSPPPRSLLINDLCTQVER